MTQETTSSSELDLSFASKLWSTRRHVLKDCFAGGIFVFLSCLWWYLAAETLLKGEWDRALGWSLFALILDGGAFLVLWVDAFRWLPPPTSLHIGSEGLTVRYPKKTRVMKWSDPRFRLVIEHHNKALPGSGWVALEREDEGRYDLAASLELISTSSSREDRQGGGSGHYDFRQDFTHPNAG